MTIKRPIAALALFTATAMMGLTACAGQSPQSAADAAGSDTAVSGSATLVFRKTGEPPVHAGS